MSQIVNSPEIDDIIEYLKTIGVNAYPYGNDYFYYGFDPDNTFGFICKNKEVITVRVIYVDLFKSNAMIDTFEWNKQKFEKKLNDITKIYRSNKKFNKLQAIKNIAKDETF